MNTTPSDAATSRFNTVDSMAGFLAAASIALSGVALAQSPVLLAPVAAILAFVASRMSSRIQQLGLAAMLASVIGFVAGMSLAVITDHPLF